MWPEMMQSLGIAHQHQASDFYLCRHLEHFDLAAWSHLPAHQPVEGWQADVLNLEKIEQLLPEFQLKSIWSIRRIKCTWPFLSRGKHSFSPPCCTFVLVFCTKAMGLVLATLHLWVCVLPTECQDSVNSKDLQKTTFLWIPMANAIASSHSLVTPR